MSLIQESHARRAVFAEAHDRPVNVLFIGTGNSALSILAEAILNRLGGGKFRAYSAVSRPDGEINPHALAVLKNARIDVAEFRPKNWSEFAKPGSPLMDFVFTVGDGDEGEACPIWPGAPRTAIWSLADPAKAMGTPAEIAFAFSRAFKMLSARISIMASLPFGMLTRLSPPEGPPTAARPMATATGG